MQFDFSAQRCCTVEKVAPHLNNYPEECYGNIINASLFIAQLLLLVLKNVSSFYVRHYLKNLVLQIAEPLKHDQYTEHLNKYESDLVYIW